MRDKRLWSLGLALLLAGWAQAAARNETQVYGIAKFGGSGECGSSGMTHPVHTDTAAAFKTVFDALKLLGQWDDTYTRNNKEARGDYFTDASKAASCSCAAGDTTANAGADEADVIYVHTHGGRSTTGVGYTELSMGNSAYDCGVRTDQNMLWNSDLDIAVIKACESGDYDVWHDGGYRQQFTNSNSPLRMWNAFHGDSSCGSHVTSYVSWYALNSIWNGVGENWLDAAYDDDGGNGSDDCPVSIVMGSSKSARRNMYEWGGWRDRKDTGAKTGSTIFFIGGCSPANGRKLPS